MKHLLLPIVVITLGASHVRAQSATGPAFDAASVKLNKAGPGRGGLQPQPGGRLTGTNVTTATLIRFAYDLPDFLIVGGPNWLNSDRFDVAAKADGDPTLQQKRLMLRELLAARFKLVVHTELRNLPIYALTMARSDGRLGPQLHHADTDCARGDQPSLDQGIGPAPPDGPSRCGYFGFAPGTDFPAGRGAFAFRGLTMAAFGKILAPMVRRSVSDQTALTGVFDAEFDFIGEVPPPPPPPGMPNPFTTPFPSIFSVLPEQLGLKLDSRRAPVEMLIVDRVEAPTPD